MATAAHVSHSSSSASNMANMPVYSSQLSDTGTAGANATSVAGDGTRRSRSSAGTQRLLSKNGVYDETYAEIVEPEYESIDDWPKEISSLDSPVYQAVSDTNRTPQACVIVDVTNVNPPGENLDAPGERVECYLTFLITR